MEEPEPTGCLCFRRKGRKVRKAPAQVVAQRGSRGTDIAKAAAPQAQKSGDWQPVSSRPVLLAEAASLAAARIETAEPVPPAPTAAPATCVLDAAQAGAHAAPDEPNPAPTQIGAGDQPPAPMHPAPAAEHTDAHTHAAPLVAGLQHDTLRALSASSRASHASYASTAYFSAGGWSHFGEDGEGIGPPLARASPRSQLAAARELAAGGQHASPAARHAAPQAPHAAAFATAAGGEGAAAEPAAVGARASAPEAVVLAAKERTADGHQQEELYATSGPPSPSAAAADADQPTGLAATHAARERSAGAAAKGGPASGLSGPAGPAAATGPGAAEERSALLDRVAELYVLQGRPCKACQALLAYCRAAGVSPDSLRAPLRERELPDAEGLAHMAQSVSDSISDLSSEAGWQVVRDDELRLLYRHLPERGVHAFRAHCELDAPAEHLVALTREVDLCPTWNKYCSLGAVLRQRSLTDVAVYMSLWVPWPFNDVGFCLDATGADLYDEEGRIVITFSSPGKAGGDEGLQLPPAAAGHTKIRLLRPSCLSFTPLPPKAPGGPSRTRASVQCYCDPGTRHVPSFIIAFVLKVLSPFMYGAVKKVLAGAFRCPDDPLPLRVKERAELYDMVRRRTQEYLAKQSGA